MNVAEPLWSTAVTVVYSPLCEDLITDAAAEASIATVVLFLPRMLQFTPNAAWSSQFKSKDKWQVSEWMKVDATS